MKIKITIFSILFFIVLYSCNNKEEVVVYEGFTQGSTFSVKYFIGANTTKDEINKTIDSILSQIDLTASIYNQNSLISKINNNDSNVKLNEYFVQIFNESNKISDLTNGVFDITVGPLVAMWGFGLKNNYQNKDYNLIIEQNKVDSLLKLINYKNINIENGKVVKKYKNIKIDFNAIAQGYTVDVIAEYLKNIGIDNFLVEVGGEVCAKGVKQDDQNWMVGIEKPADSSDATQQIKYKIPLKDKALATSGNYRKYIEKNGVKYSHTINPKTGYPVQHSLLSVSVITDNCTTADALATAFMVMGKDEAIQFIKQNNNLCEAYFIYSDKYGKIQTYATPKIRKVVEEIN